MEKVYFLVEKVKFLDRKVNLQENSLSYRGICRKITFSEFILQYQLKLCWHSIFDHFCLHFGYDNIHYFSLMKLERCLTASFFFFFPSLFLLFLKNRQVHQPQQPKRARHKTGKKMDFCSLSTPVVNCALTCVFMSVHFLLLASDILRKNA